MNPSNQRSDFRCRVAQNWADRNALSRLRGTGNCEKQSIPLLYDLAADSCRKIEGRIAKVDVPDGSRHTQRQRLGRKSDGRTVHDRREPMLPIQTVTEYQNECPKNAG